MRRPPPLLSHPAHIPDQTGRRFVVTGATGGLGLELTRALATAGGEVVMAVRNVRAGEQAADRVRRTGAGGTVVVCRLDLSDLSSVREFAAAQDGVDVLVNNAGIMGVPRASTVDGFELQLGTNHLGHFALTNLVLPRIRDRVVVVGSAAHRNGVLDVDDLHHERRGYQPYAAYAQSKLANLLFMSELQRRLADSGSRIRCLGGHPGYTSTGIQSGTGNRAFTRISDLGNAVLGMRPWRGALPVLAAATLDLPGGSYLGPSGPAELLGLPRLVGRSARARDQRLAAALWHESEVLTATSFPGPGRDQAVSQRSPRR